MSESTLRLLLLAIAAITFLSGLTQWVAPGFVLSVVAADTSALSRQLFATVGMFMLITGGMFFQSLRANSPEPAIPFWIAAQKSFAAALVAYAVFEGIFLPISLGVAALDALSGVLAFLYWRRVR
ncbi:MAG: hypothetical protein PW843_20005 [Azospirillaceae bacterium]|nr:hypothetical protein [Azospirillaceae bacterium]